MTLVYIQITEPTHEDHEYATKILEESKTLEELKRKLRPNMKVLEV